MELLEPWLKQQANLKKKLKSRKRSGEAAKAGKAGSKQAGKALPKQAQLNNLIIN